MTDSGNTERLPRLLGTRESAARKIAGAIRDFEQLRARIPQASLPDLQDDFDIRRRHTTELLRSLFDQPGPANEFDHETTRSVFYATSDDQRRQDLADDARLCITQLRSLTARLDFYQPPAEQRPTSPHTDDTRTPQTPRKPESGPSLLAVLLFIIVLLGTAGLIIWLRQEIAQLAGPAAAVFFLIISLVPAILLFGLFRAVARATGTLYGLKVELGGPTALFVVVLLILLNVPKQETATAAPTTTSTTTATSITSTQSSTTSTQSSTTAPTAKEPPPTSSQLSETQRWKTVITAHGTPTENPKGWLDGRYTAYIKDGPNRTITSDPVSMASHAGYVVDTPHKGRYLVTVAYAATTDRPVNVFTAPDVPHENGEDIFGASKTQLSMPKTVSPVTPQRAEDIVLHLEVGRNVIDLRAASPAGLPNLFSVTIMELKDNEFVIDDR